MDYLHLVAVFISNEWLWVAHGFSFNHITQLESFVFCNKFKSFTLVVQPNWLQSGNTKLFLKRLFVECLKKCIIHDLKVLPCPHPFDLIQKCGLFASWQLLWSSRERRGSHQQRGGTGERPVPVNPPNMNRNRNRFPFNTYCSSYLNKYLLSVIFFHDQLLLISGDPSWGCEVWSVKDTVKTYYTSVVSSFQVPAAALFGPQSSAAALHPPCLPHAEGRCSTPAAVPHLCWSPANAEWF